MTVEWLGIKKPLGGIVQWHVPPTDFDSLPSGQVFFAQCSLGHHDKHRKGTLHGGGGKQNRLIPSCCPMGQLLGNGILYLTACNLPLTRT